MTIKYFPLIGLLSTVSLVVSCENKNHSSLENVVDNSGFPKPLTCEANEGNPLRLNISSPAFKPDPKDIGLKGNVILRPINKTALDVCSNEDELKIYPKRIFTWINEHGSGAWMSIFRVLTLENSKEDLGIFKALQDGDVTDIHISFENPDKSKNSYYLTGWKLSTGEQVVTLSPYLGDDPLLLPSQDQTRVEYGVLSIGNPFEIQLDCHTKKYEFDTLSISYNFCKSGNHGTRIVYHFKSLNIKDSNPALANPINFKVIGEDETQKYLSNTTTHHSLLDEFNIKLPEVSYSIHYGTGVFDNMILTAKYSDNSSVDHTVPCTEVYNCGTEFIPPN